MLAGAAWLVAAGPLFALRGLDAAGPRHDAALHAVLVGYVLSMVLARAPIIFPAVARVDLPFHGALWPGPALLHASLALRVAGDVADSSALRSAGTTGNALALAAFVAGVAVARSRGATR